MKYRSDIDGLRAIAIILVLLYHGGISLFPSGFIGVDVFFVISGYLITGIIHQSLADNRFSFMEFYNRRLWRLQPVLICFIFVTTLLTLVFFLPDDLIQFSRSARKASLFMSNLFFNHTTTGYFSPDVHQLPLLHTWSLAIEWQCYLILPVFMYALHRIVSLKYLAKVIYALTFVCLLVSFYYSKALPAQTYYQLSSRLFEFLIGSCVALVPMTTITIHRYVLNVLGGVALVVIISMASFDTILLGYPNGYALLVCIATALLIALGRYFPSGFIASILSFKPLVFIGILSYSLYIWHWPIFALLRYQTIAETPLVLSLVYGLILCMAYLSWRYIEKPSRQLKWVAFPYTVILLLLLPIFLVHTIDYVIKKNLGLPQRFNQELVTVYQQLNQYNSQQRPLCISNTHSNSEQCTVGSKQPHHQTALMIGDSFSNHYWGFMDVLGQDANVSILAKATSSCITLPGIYLYDWWIFKQQVYQDCYSQTKHYYQMINNNHYDYVIIGQVWNNYLANNIINHLGDKRSVALSKQRIKKALDKALGLIIASGARPILIKTTAISHDNQHDCFLKHIKLRQPYDKKACRFQPQDEQWFSDLFTGMQVKYPSLIIIDPKLIYCHKGLCNADINGIPIYRDMGHITDYASYQLGHLYLKKWTNPFLKMMH